MNIKPRHVKMARAAWRGDWKGPTYDFAQRKWIESRSPIIRWHRAARGK